MLIIILSCPAVPVVLNRRRRSPERTRACNHSASYAWSTLIATNFFFSFFNQKKPSPYTANHISMCASSDSGDSLPGLCDEHGFSTPPRSSSPICGGGSSSSGRPLIYSCTPRSLNNSMSSQSCGYGSRGDIHADAGTRWMTDKEDALLACSLDGTDLRFCCQELQVIEIIT